MIKIGKVIYQVLAANPDIVNAVGNKIYPLIAPENTSGNYIVYKRNYTNEQTRDNYLGQAEIELIIITTDYNTGIDISSACIDSINSIKGDAGNYYIQNSNNTGGGESYTVDGYIQNLTFSIKAAYNYN